MEIESRNKYSWEIQTQDFKKEVASVEVEGQASEEEVVDAEHRTTGTMNTKGLYKLKKQVDKL